MSYELLGLFIGYIAIPFHLIAFYKNDSRKIVLIFIFWGTLLYGISVGIGGNYNGLIISVVSSILMVISYFIKSNLKRKQLSMIAPVIAFSAFYIFDEGFLSILPSLGTLFSTYALFQSDMIKMKVFYLLSAISWLGYGVYIDSLPAILFDVSGIAILLYSIATLLKERRTMTVI